VVGVIATDASESDMETFGLSLTDYGRGTSFR
jgi:hypothetical protein